MKPYKGMRAPERALVLDLCAIAACWAAEAPWWMGIAWVCYGIFVRQDAVDHLLRRARELGGRP